jgi:PAS domain S-box-containing protein
MVALRTGKEVRGEAMGVFNPSLGGHTWISVNAVLKPGPVGPAEASVFTTFEDITNQTLSEIALRDTEERLRRFFESAQEMIVLHQMVTDAAGSPVDYRIVDCNPSFLAITGMTRERAVGALASVLYGTPQAPYLDTYAAVVQSGKSHTFETYFAPMDKHFRVSAFSTGPGRFATTSHDITDRKKAEEALQVSEARFRALADEAPIGVYQTDVEGRNVYLNRAGEAILGLSKEEASGAGWNASIHPEDRDRVVREYTEAIAAGRVFESEYRFKRRDGSVVVARGYATSLRSQAGTVTGYIGVVMDITALKGLETQLALTSRLAALGTLVAGVAHEVNNPLAAALSGQDLALGTVRELRDRLRGGGPLDREAEVHQLDEVVEELGEAREAGRRIERIVKDLKVFGRPNHKDARERIRLIDVVDLAMRWLPAAISQTAIVTAEDGGAPDVVATAGQITQVVVNLVTNAAKATPEGARGAIVIRIGPGTPGMARLEVIDHGSGIEPAVLPHIFDPYFTTSDVGKGTGLGLSICHSIVTAHGGTLGVESEVGKGSTFRVELPAALALGAAERGRP